jgi:DNA-binding MarR family transcriptional regulator
VFETSRLVVELLHAAHASRRTPAVPGHEADAAGDLAAPASDHAIRAAIHLYQHGDRTVGQLAAGLGISRGWASRVADEMVARGRVERETDPHDRRVVRLRLTGLALAEIEQAYRWRGDVVAGALERLDPAGRDAVRRFLREVAAGLAGPSEPRR